MCFVSSVGFLAILKKQCPKLYECAGEVVKPYGQWMKASNMRNTLNSGEWWLRLSPPVLSDDIFGSCSESAVARAIDLTISTKSEMELSKGNDEGGNYGIVPILKETDAHLPIRI